MVFLTTDQMVAGSTPAGRATLFLCLNVGWLRFGVVCSAA